MATSKHSLVQTALLAAIRQEGNDTKLPSNATAQRQLLGDLLIASNTHWKQDTLKLIDEIYKAEKTDNNNVAVKVQDIAATSTARIHTTKLALWRGDITNLAVEAIVNAANDEGLGCFVPHHRCIDNVIHRAAGPRLRLACQEVMAKRSTLLATGSAPIVTPAFHLPSQWVIHVTGPQISSGKPVSERDAKNLASAYVLSLDAAVQQGAKSIAFPCISTGLFGYPQDQAARLAFNTVCQWVDHHPGALEWVIFDVFSARDEELYRACLESSPWTAATTTPRQNPVTAVAIPEKMNRLAKTWIEQADAILICAGAGMSVKEGEMVYTNPEDFAAHYPFLPKWGYRTGYEAMGLFADTSVPITVKWAFWAKHLDNMRWRFEPNDGYHGLRQLVDTKDHFVLTSNVDGCFERAGFDPRRIYTPQGEWTYLQCMKPCRDDSVFEARPYLDQLLPSISKDGYIPKEMVPKCPRCGGDMFGNVRGGSWFLHHTKYDSQSKALRQWMEQQVGRQVVVIEVGAGFNTPMVTRWPVESFVREIKGKLIRINPSDPELPSDVEGLCYALGWQTLQDIQQAAPFLAKDDSDTVAIEVAEFQSQNGRLVPAAQTKKIAKHVGHFDWRLFLGTLQR